MSNSIRIVAQNFYGNRTLTDISLEKLDWFILGFISEDAIKFGERTGKDEKMSREVIDIPNTDCVLIYNPIMEEDDRKNLSKPVAIIPELGLEIYSRCIICRKDKDGNFASLTPDDYEKVKKYLAE